MLLVVFQAEFDSHATINSCQKLRNLMLVLSITLMNLRHFFTEFVSVLCALEKRKLTKNFKSEDDKASKIHLSIKASSYIALQTDFGY